jgi:hypothetical protein
MVQSWIFFQNHEVITKNFIDIPVILAPTQQTWSGSGKSPNFQTKAPAATLQKSRAMRIIMMMRVTSTLQRKVNQQMEKKIQLTMMRVKNRNTTHLWNKIELIRNTF